MCTHLNLNGCRCAQIKIVSEFNEVGAESRDAVVGSH